MPLRARKNETGWGGEGRRLCAHIRLLVSGLDSLVPHVSVVLLPICPCFRYLMERVCVNLMRGCATLPSTDDAVFSSLTMLTQLRPDTTELVAPRIAAVSYSSQHLVLQASR